MIFLRLSIIFKIIIYIIKIKNQIANIIITKQFKDYQINLVGFGLGANVVKHCLKHLSLLNGTKNYVKFKHIYNNYNISPYSAQNTINYKRIENKVDSNNNNDVKSKELIYMMNKGEDLLKRTKKLLGYYIILTDQIKELTEKKNEF